MNNNLILSIFVANMEKFNDIQIIKRRFFAMRNGVIADTLRKSGVPYRMIFGLNLPQIVEIASEIGPNREIAEKLHADTPTRESQMLAPMIMPVADMTPELALQWVDEAPSVEATDILCHRLLRKMPEAIGIAETLLKRGGDARRYAAVRLMWNLIPAHSDAIYPIARAEASRGDDSTSQLAAKLVEEIEFLKN